MKKLTAGLATLAVALTHSLAVAAEPAAMLERTGSPISESEELTGGGGIWAVLLAVAVGVGVILLIEEEEDDIPASP